MACSLQLDAQLTAGPMLGYVEYREAALWVEVGPETKIIKVKYWSAKDPKNKLEIEQKVEPTGFQYIPQTLILRDLEADTKYEAMIYVDGKAVGTKLKFKTKKIWRYREDPPAFSFIYGSCAYLNDPPYDRPGKAYGQGLQIFETMAKTPKDFMIWGGDNLYFRPADETSESGLRYRYHHFRSKDTLAALFASCPHYAVWDDHDYGPNNSDRSYRMKETTLQLFKEYWPAVKYGHEEHPGIYQTFTWEDLDFFLLDDRYHRTNPRLEEEKALLGKDQLQWLKESLLKSRAPFKIVVTGSQFLNNHQKHEGFYQYPMEREALISFIVEHKIKNVIFLSGDRHFTEVLEQSRNGIKLVDITCSPFSSRPPKMKEKDKEANNPDRVDGTLVDQQNFIKVSVSGKRKKRVLKVDCLDEEGNVLWTKEWE